MCRGNGGRTMNRMSTPLAPETVPSRVPAARRTVPAAGPAWRRAAERLDAATPPERDRTVDALRAFAIFGVVIGHWLVTALVADGNGELRTLSPLKYLPGLVPVSWVFQTLAVFFFVGGYTAARSLASARRAGRPYRDWLGDRLSRLLRPVPVLLLAWIPLSAGLWAAGFEPATLGALGKLIVTPLWFLFVYGLLTALTPLALRLRERLGARAALVPLAVVAAVDLVRFAPGARQWPGVLDWVARLPGVDRPGWMGWLHGPGLLDGPGWLNVAAGWLVPYCLGVAWAGGAFTSRRSAYRLLLGGAAATIALVAWFGYPASMVGVPGARISNLNPPTLAAVTFGIAQVGLALLLRDALARWMRRPLAWMGVAVANMSAMTVFLWHQTAMIGVTVLALPLGPLPGLHTAPGDPVWPLHRLAWLPVFAAALAICLALFRRWEHPKPPAAGRGAGAAPAVRGAR
jgi:peptidoglycan/LPS O-acetylase OafA/YrhL